MASENIQNTLFFYTSTIVMVLKNRVMWICDCDCDCDCEWCSLTVISALNLAIFIPSKIGQFYWAC